MWKNILEPLRPRGNAIGRMRIENLSVQTHTQNMKYLLLFYGLHSYANAPEYDVFTMFTVLSLYVIAPRLSKQLVCLG